MATVEVSRTLVKSVPELWSELQRGEPLSDAVGEVTLRTTEHERALAWEGSGARGRVLLEPSGWGTRVTLTAELERAVAGHGLWERLRDRRPHDDPRGDARHRQLEHRLEELLDNLGAAHRRPFARD